MNRKIFFSFLFFSFTFFYLSASETIERALNIVLQPTNIISSEEAAMICQDAMKQIELCNYEKALEIILKGIEQFPQDFSLQNFFAALIGDHSENFMGSLKERMIQKSKEAFNKLINELEGQSEVEIYRFKNEYFFRFAQYKDQYKNGLEAVRYYEEQQQLSLTHIGKGYYYQGVGAAYYAKQLFMKNDKELALEYAQKSIVAWAQYFSYENTYYNSYVHYALALGILGYKEEMLRALQRSATLINCDLTYHEFTEVIDLFDEK